MQSCNYYSMSNPAPDQARRIHTSIVSFSKKKNRYAFNSRDGASRVMPVCDPLLPLILKLPQFCLYGSSSFASPNLAHIRFHLLHPEAFFVRRLHSLASPIPFHSLIRIERLLRFSQACPHKSRSSPPRFLSALA